LARSLKAVGRFASDADLASIRHTGWFKKIVSG
jgi:hypothetical protein